MNDITAVLPANTEVATAPEIENATPVDHLDTAPRDPAMPPGYALLPDGVYVWLNDDESTPPIFVCSPLRIDATFSKNDGTGWGKTIAVKNPDGEWKAVQVMNSELAGPSSRVLSRLIDCGLQLAPSKKAKEQLISLLDQWKPDFRMITTDKLGWVDQSHNAFALPGDVIGSDTILSVTPAAVLSGHLTCSGTVNEWKRAIGLKCAGNPMMVLAVSLAFSGPMLSIVGIASGGLHFRGSSSSGKTTLLQLAASVWGNPGLVMQWRATDNGLESIAPTLNDMLLPLDEIAGILAKHLHNAIYMLANGIGKGRMTKQPETWRLALISTGEISVAEKFREEKLAEMPGQEVRLIDIEADARLFGVFDNLHSCSDGSAFSDEMKSAASQFHGTAGRAFVDYVIANRFGPRIKQTVRSIQEAAVRGITGPFSGQVSRVAQRFAIIGVAGEVATKAGITGWEPGYAMHVAISEFKNWYARKHGEAETATVEFAALLKAFIAANINAMHEVGSATTEPAVVGWKDATCVYLPSKVWESIYPGLDGTEAAKALIASHVLLPGEAGRNMKKSPREIPGRPRLFTINLGNLENLMTK